MLTLTTTLDLPLARYEEPEAAAECARAMDGRFFDGRRVSATFYPIEAFYEGEFGHDGGIVPPSAITWDDIVAMNSRPASSWDTMTNAPNGALAADPMAVDEPAAAAASSSSPAKLGEPAPRGESDVTDEPSDFHSEFLRAMRAQAAEAARQAAHSAQEVLEGADDAMDALVEEFPDAAERAAPGSDDDDDDDDEGGGVVRARAKKRELPKVDHATIEYAPFRKKFYIEVPEIKNMSDEQIAALRKELDGIKVRRTHDTTSSLSL